MTDSIIRARVEPELKAEAVEVLRNMGLTPSAAIRLFFRQVVAEKALPFPIKVPNAETRAAMEEIKNNPNLPRYTSLEAMWKDLKSDD